MTQRVPDIGDIVKVRADHKDIKFYSDFNGERSTYRVGGWLKSWQRPERKAPAAGDKRALMAHLLQGILDESNREFDCGKGPTRLQFCTREEAEYVEIIGACGHTLPVEDVEVVGKVNWSEEVIEEERRGALLLVGEVVF